MVTSLKILFSAVLVFMGYAIVSTSMQSNLFKEWDYLAGIPWMKATLWDFYANVLVLSVWICYKEAALWKKIVWIILLATLGSIGTCAYLLVQLFGLKENEPWTAIFSKRNS